MSSVAHQIECHQGHCCICITSCCDYPPCWHPKYGCEHVRLEQSLGIMDGMLDAYPLWICACRRTYSFLACWTRISIDDTCMSLLFLVSRHAGRVSFMICACPCWSISLVSHDAGRVATRSIGVVSHIQQVYIISIFWSDVVLHGLGIQLGSVILAI